MGAPDRFNSMGGLPSAGGPGTPNRHGQLPPSVIISPSAPVRQLTKMMEIYANYYLSSIFLLLAQRKQCLMTLRLPRPVKSR